MAGNGIFAEILDGDVFKYYADGEWKKSNSGKSVPIVNPTTRRTHYKVQGSQIIFHSCFVSHFASLFCHSLLNLVHSYVMEQLDHTFFSCICFETACSQEEVNKVMEAAKAAQKLWAKTPLWKRAELLHKAAAILKEHKAPIAECLVKEIAKPAKDAVTEVPILTSKLLYEHTL